MPGEAQWTAEQRRAIEGRGKDILVSAAAGSGKTSVLVQRVVQRLLDVERPIDIDRMLVVTFTESAAAEMRERIRVALEEAQKSEAGRRAAQQLGLLGKASISTLHGFCLELLRRHFFLLGLDPRFRVMDEEEARLLRLEILDRLFESIHSGLGASGDDGPADGDLGCLFDHYGGRRDDRDLRTIVLELYQYVRSLPDGDGWLASAVSAFDPDAPEYQRSLAAWKETLCRRAALDVEQALVSLRRAAGISRQGAGPVTYLPSFEAAGSSLRKVLHPLQEGAWDDAAAALAAVTWPRLKAPEEADPSLQHEAQNLWKRAKEQVGKWREGAFKRSLRAYADEAKRLFPVVAGLCRIVTRFEEGYTDRKRNLGVVDFADLERLALQALGGSQGQLAGVYRRRFDEVMFDEYQDINPVQDRLLTLVSRGDEGARNRFLVGDVKQSIYRFRLADPRIFQEKFEAFADPDDPGSCRIDLQANFRSHPAIVDGVNFLFRQVMHGRVGEIEYGPEAWLKAGVPVPVSREPGCEDREPMCTDDEGRVQLHLVERLDTEGASFGLPAVEREALLVGHLIRRLVAESDTAYRDIAVLMRSPKGRVNRFFEVFESLGIPAYSQSGTGFFHAVEVQVITSLLRLLDNPRQDIPLAGVLRSPIVSLTSRDLARIRLAAPESAFFDAVTSVASRDDSLGHTLQAFLLQLDAWRTNARRLPLSRLLWQLYRETGYLDFVSGLPRGRRREANLWGLYQRARRFDRYATQGLDRFIRYVDDLEEAGEDAAPPPALGDGEDVVQLMSVHQSKGLEFPVVILADIDRNWNLTDARRHLVFHRDLGIGPAVVDRTRHVRYPSLAHRAVVARLNQDTLAEEMRLLYVATTRAKERLICVGSVRDLPGRCALWSEATRDSGWSLPDGTLMGARSWLDWLGAAVARHRDGEPLRRAGAGDLGSNYYRPCDREVADDAARISVTLWDGRLIDAPAPEPGTEGGETPIPWERVGAGRALDVEVDPQVKDSLDHLHGWEYSKRALTRMPAKLTVTEVSKLWTAEEEDALELSPVETHKRRSPRSMEGEAGVSAAQRGSATHLLLARLDLGRDLTRGDLKTQLDAVVERELLTRDEAESVDLPAIERFFRTDIGVRMAITGRAGVKWKGDGPRLWRELPFTMNLPLDFTPGLEADIRTDLLTAVSRSNHRSPRSAPDAATGDDAVVLQGTLDCLLRDETGYVLLDYKTDAVVPGLEEEAGRRYAWQIALYAEFVRRLVSPPSLEAYLFFLSTGRAVRVDG